MSVDNNIPNGWVETTLADVVSKLGDGLHGTPKYSDDGEYYFINGNNLNEGKIQLKKETKRCSKEEYDKYKKNLNSRTILVSINGSLGYFAYYNNEKCFLGKSACYFNVKDDISKKFIGYQIRANYFQKYIERLAGGTTIKNVSLKTMREFPFIIPQDTNEQKAIAKILTSFDDKIENLQSQNKTLETTAQTIFKEWFGKYQIGDVLPEGWRVGKLGDLIEKTIDNRGKTPPLSNEDGCLMLETYQMNAKTPFPNFSQDSKKKHVTTDIYNNWFRSGHPIYLDILFATVGNGIPNWCFMPKNKDKYCIAQNLVAFRAKTEISGIYLKYFFDTRNFINLCNGIIITTAQPSIKLSHLRLLDIVIPKQELINSFNLTIKPMVDLIFNNTEQIQSLKKTRDTLLPKLMSGSLRVNDFKN